MSKEFDHIIREIAKQNKELHNLDNQISKEVVKDVFEIKKTIKTLENKITKIDFTIGRIYDLLNSITIFIEDAENMHDENMEEDEDWASYNEENFSYNDNNDDEDEESEDTGWGNYEDES